MRTCLISPLTIELHEQLEQLMSTLEQVPLVVFSGVRRECQAKADKEWKAELDARLQKLEESSKAAVCSMHAPASLCCYHVVSNRHLMLQVCAQQWAILARDKL